MKTSSTPLPMPRAKRLEPIRVEAIIAMCCLACIFVQVALPAFRAVAYAIPILSMIAILATRRLSAPPNAAPYLIMLVAGLAMAPLGTLKGLQDIWLMMMGLSPFFFGYKYDVGWRPVFIATVVATAMSLGMSAGSGAGFAFDAAKSVSSFEASTSFIFGVLSVWAMLEKRWWRAGLALLLTVLTLKRIVVMAALAVLVMVLLPRRLADRLLRPLPMLLLNALFLVATIVYAQGGFNEWISTTFGQSSDELGMGRQYLYQAPVRLLLDKPLEFGFYGLGAGGIYNLLWTYGDQSYRSLHNDSMKILVEYGGIVWVAVFAALYWSRNFAVRAMALFTNVLWLTDNTLIYGWVILPITLALLSLTSPAKQPVDAPSRPPRPRKGWSRQVRPASG